MRRHMTSREIAVISDKQHKHVMEAIRLMEPAWEKINGSKFRLVEYMDAKGEKRPQYELSKTECLYIATKFNDEARARLIVRWEELERQAFNPDSLSRLDIARMLLEAETERAMFAQKVSEQQELLQIQAPKVLFADAVQASKTSILIGELAKILNQNGVIIGQNRLFDWLRRNSYLISRQGTDYNMPTQKSMELGLFEIKETPIHTNSGEIRIGKTSKVTGKGQTYFVNKFLHNDSSNSITIRRGARSISVS
jgi:anti-repressor protein